MVNLKIVASKFESLKKLEKFSRYSPSLSDSDLSLNLHDRDDAEDDDVENEHLRSRPCWSSPPNFFDDTFRGTSPTNREFFDKNASTSRQLAKILERQRRAL